MFFSSCALLFPPKESSVLTECSRTFSMILGTIGSVCVDGGREGRVKVVLSGVEVELKREGERGGVSGV